MNATKKRRAFRTSEEMFPIISRFADSGMTQRAFCDQESISMSVFQYWLKKYRNVNGDTGTGCFHEISLVPDSVSFNSSQRNIIIRTASGMTIEIPLD